jgi:hypothetical protein
VCIKTESDRQPIAWIATHSLLPGKPFLGRFIRALTQFVESVELAVIFADSEYDLLYQLSDRAKKKGEEITVLA